MRLARAQSPDYARPVLVRLEGPRAVVIAEESAHVAADVLRESLHADLDLRGAGMATVEAGELRLLSPVARPGRILCAALNYGAHAAETGKTPPVEPVMFPKFTGSLVASGEAAVVPDPDLAAGLDYEGELAFVVGRTATSVDPADALDHVLGYTVANDLSARIQQRADGQWWRGKGSDGLCPIGPVLVTTDELGDASDLEIRTTVNGELRQHGSTSDLIFGVRELVSFVSRFVTLEPGDVVLTGTPPGVGDAMNPPQFLADGDVVTVEIERVGRLESRISIP